MIIVFVTVTVTVTVIQFSMTDLSLAHSVTSMVENHTALTGFHYRYGYKMKVIYYERT